MPPAWLGVRSILSGEWQDRLRVPPCVTGLDQVCQPGDGGEGYIAVEDYIRAAITF